MGRVSASTATGRRTNMFSLSGNAERSESADCHWSSVVRRSCVLRRDAVLS